MIVDTSALLAFFDRGEPRHHDVVKAMEDHDGAFIVSPYVVAELDYLVLTRHGSRAERAVLQELSGGAWELASMDADRLREATEIVERYSDVPIGLADASNAVLAAAYRVRSIATLDRRHFSILRDASGAPFEIVP